MLPGIAGCPTLSNPAQRLAEAGSFCGDDVVPRYVVHLPVCVALRIGFGSFGNMKLWVAASTFCLEHSHLASLAPVGALPYAVSP
jgi:hypothetical protein